MQYTLTKQVAARTNTQTYSVGLDADPHVYGTQRAQLACFFFVPLSIFLVCHSLPKRPRLALVFGFLLVN